MKAILIVILLLTLIADNYTQSVVIDISVEPLISVIRPQNTTYYDYGSGLGCSLKIPVGLSLLSYIGAEIRPGISFYTSSASANRLDYGPGTNYAENKKYRFIYISFPLYLRINPIEETSFYIGINSEYLVMAREGSLTGISVKNTFNRRYNLGLSGGFSYRFLNGMKFFMFYTYGLSALATDRKIIYHPDNSSSGYKITLNSFTIGLSFRIYRKESRQ